MSQVGRIGGQVLSDNLLRAGVDLAFETNLLYLDVNNNKISIKTSPPIYDFDVNSNIRTTNLTVDNQAALDNIKLVAPNTISTIVGGIDVYIQGGGELFHDRLTTANLVIDGNLISSTSNSNIVFDPNGSGTVELLSTTNITGNLGVTGNINMSGNLTGLGTLTLGDQTIDTLTINPDFTQSIIPGDDITYAIGADAGDSTPRRWRNLYAPEWRYISTGAWDGSGINTNNMFISNQMFIDGVTNKISTIQSNEDILLNPDTGIVYVESTRWENSDITNLNNTAITLASTGTGYYRFPDTNAFVIPTGTNAERRLTPEVGETRYNTEEGYLECFDGTVWIVSTGGGEEVTQEFMNDLGHAYILILG